MLDKISNGIEKTTEFLKKVNHVLTYFVIIAWLLVPVAYIIKLIIK